MLIGKKGVTINEIQKVSKANIEFGKEEIALGVRHNKVIVVTGTVNQVADACKVIAVKLGQASSSLEYKIVFLVPDQFCGMFIGKKGSRVKEIRGDVDQHVQVVVSKDPILLPGSNKVTLCTIYGPRENVRNAIERAVSALGAISLKIDKLTMDPVQLRDGAWNGGIQNDAWNGGIQIEKKVGWGHGETYGSANWSQGPNLQGSYPQGSHPQGSHFQPPHLQAPHRQVPRRGPW